MFVNIAFSRQFLLKVRENFQVCSNCESSSTFFPRKVYPEALRTLENPGGPSELISMTSEALEVHPMKPHHSRTFWLWELF